LAAPRHRIACVNREVEHDLFELIRIDLRDQRLVDRFDVERNRRRNKPPQHRAEALEGRTGRNHGRLGLIAAAAEAEQQLRESPRVIDG
jgi:hypothetical protein